MPAKLKQKKRQQEEQASDASENQNDYQKDDFVVGSEDDISNDDLKDVENEEYYSLDYELSEDDLQLIEENKKKKKGRLQRKVDTSDEEIQKDDSEYMEDQQRVKKQTKRRSPSPEAYGYQDEDEVVPESERKKVLESLFDPQQRQSGFLQELDQKIISTDIPERVQLLYYNMLNRLPDELGQRDVCSEEEVVWVTDRLLSERPIPIKPSEKQQFQEGVKMVLDFYRKDNFETQFVITYKRYLVNPLIGNDLYWRIQELDVQWERFLQQRQSMQAKIRELRKNNSYISSLVERHLEQAVREQQLGDISEYLKYIEIKTKCEKIVKRAREVIPIQSLEQVLQSLSLSSGVHRKREQLLCEAFYFGIDDLSTRVLLKADDLAELLNGNPQPIIVSSKLGDMTLDKLNTWVRAEHQSMKDQKSVILFLQKFICLELFMHPVIRWNIGQEYFRYAQISTDPTPTGNREISSLSYLYPVKRIKNRPVKYIEDETYLMLVQAEELDYITTKFKIQEVHKQEKSSTSLKDDEIMATLQAKLRQAQQSQMMTASSGTRLENLRDFILRQFLVEQMYPFLETRLREHLKEQGQQAVLRICCHEFHTLLNQQPHQSNMELEQQTNSEPCVKPVQENKKVMSLVLVNDENPRENELAKTFTANFALERKHVGMAIVDGYGEVLNTHIFNYLLVNKYQKPGVQDQRDKEIQIIQGLLAQYQPDLIVISANQPECLRLRADLREQYSGKCWISIADTSISHIYSLSERSHIQHPETPQVLREAISLARYKLNPLAEILNIWDEVPSSNGCLHLQLHPLQKMITPQALQTEYTKVACEIVNSVGVDPVDTALHTHLQGQVQFICGLGSRKAKHFMQVFKSVLSQMYLQNHFESEKRILNAMQDDLSNGRPVMIERLDLLKMNIFGRNVFKNAQSFIRFSNGKNPFDRTRMTTQMYPDAFYIVRSALDIENPHDEADYSIVLELMKQPKKLDELELEEWAMKKEKSNGIQKYIRVVNFMKNELTNPFLHHFERGGEMSNRDIFYKVTQETPYTLKKNTIVTGPIIWIKEDVLCARISESGLTGVLHKRELQPERQNLNDEFTEGQVIKAHVKSIDALDEKPNRPTRDSKNVNIFRIELTLKPEWNLEQLVVVSKPEFWNRAYPYKDYEERVRKTFEFKEFKASDCPTVQLATQPLKQQKLIIRKINHPKFKQVMLKGAIEYIESQRVGEYIIRPSSRGREFLTITWKFFEGVIVHLLVKEEHRHDNFKPKLLVGRDEYESFDEIYERYIIPCNNHMEAAANNKKFSNEKMEVLEKRLREEKEQAPAIVPYGFCVTDKAPQYLVLMYVPKDKVEKEYIKVKPDGLAFHGQVFSTLKEMTTWFKTNFRTSEYKTYMKKTKAPFADTDKVQQINQSWNQQSDIKKEKGKDEKVKYEGSDYSNVYCSKCSKRGHTANDCRDREKGQGSVYQRNTRGDSHHLQDNNKRQDYQKRGPLTCYGCNQTGHVKKNCPQLNNQQNPSRVSSAWERNDALQGWNAPSQHQRNKSRSRSRDKSEEVDY